MDPLSQLAAAGLGSSLGAYLSPSGNNNYTNPQFIDQMNNILNQAKNNAINTSTNYTNQAIGQQNTSLNNATNAYNTYLNNAVSGSQQALNQGLQQYQNLQAPAAQAGYSALDAYMNTLGLATPTIGSGAVSSALQQAPQLQQLINQGVKQGSLLQNPNGTLSLANFSAPTAPGSQQSFHDAVTQAQIQNYINQNTKGNGYVGVGSNDPNVRSYSPGNTPNSGLYEVSPSAAINGGGPNSVFVGGNGNLTQSIMNSPISGDIQNYLAQQAQQQALQQYQQQQNQYNSNIQQQQALQQSLLGYSPNTLAIQQMYQQGLI